MTSLAVQGWPVGLVPVVVAVPPAAVKLVHRPVVERELLRGVVVVLIARQQVVDVGRVQPLGVYPFGLAVRRLPVRPLTVGVPGAA